MVRIPLLHLLPDSKLGLSGIFFSVEMESHSLLRENSWTNFKPGCSKCRSPVFPRQDASIFCGLRSHFALPVVLFAQQRGIPWRRPNETFLEWIVRAKVPSANTENFGFSHHFGGCTRLAPVLQHVCTRPGPDINWDFLLPSSSSCPPPHTPPSHIVRKKTLHSRPVVWYRLH